MKNYSLFIIAFTSILFSTSLHGQTKEETEKWIVEKINKYMAPRESGTRVYGYATKGPAANYNGLLLWYFEHRYYTPAQFSIQDGKIVVTYNYKVEEEPYNSDTRNKFDSHFQKVQTKNENITTKADIYLIDTSITVIRVCENPYINSEKDACFGWSDIFAIKLKCPCGILASSNGKNEKTYYLFLFMLGNEEPDLFIRLQTALARLKTFYPKPKETF